MPPRKAKAKKAAAEPATRKSTRGAKAAAVDPVEATPNAPSEEVSSEALKEQLPPTVRDAAAALSSVLGESSTAAPEPEPVDDSMAVDDEPAATTSSLPDVEMGSTGGVAAVAPAPMPALTKEERLAKLNELRSKMQSAAKANRDDVVDEHQKSMTNAREIARLEKQRKLAAILREKADAEENGIDSERKKNWEYTIEENDAWEKKLKRKKGRADFEFHDDADNARKKYKKDLDKLNPDVEAYMRQKEAALGLVPGALSKAGSSKDGALVASSSTAAARLAAEDLYRDGNTLTYGDNKPSEEAIDRVVSKLNQDLDKKNKFSRKRTNEDEGDITYINEHNKVFNKKIARYYDKYTKEIRDSFERGTAL